MHANKQGREKEGVNINGVHLVVKRVLTAVKEQKKQRIRVKWKGEK